MGQQIQMKNNCNNCKHLKWEFGDVSDPEGFVCLKREYGKHSGNDWKDEKIHLAKLECEHYREKSKKCFEAKKELNDGK